ncbi:hypothetical protein CLV84_4308 [Neolewinella xylanilytica]|uniref:Uncharacterized protein n=1 Tax=Neolewinella xylanilytica TaxID=1514080 RepID=A0A2S6HZS3_9BACT|nr:hypothetical protein CLV84_4308 [Neolewinella xylanilytica]
MSIHISHESRLLPDVFQAEVFAPALWSHQYCYAAECRTKLHFYAKGEKLRSHLCQLQELFPEEEGIIRVEVRRISFGLFDRYGLYIDKKRKVGWFDEPAGGGPQGNFYSEVGKAYRESFTVPNR